MKQTKQLMQQVITQDIIDLTDEQAVQLFRETNDSRIIAKYFLDMYHTLNTMVYKCAWGSNEDKVSSVLTGLNKALNSYTNAKGAALKSFIITCIRWHLYGIYCKQYQTKGRSQKVYSLDAMKESYDDEEFEKHILTSELNSYVCTMDNLEFVDLIKHSGLSDIQVKICTRIIKDNKSKPSEVCTDLKITMNEYNRQKNSLRKKLKFLLNY